MDWYGLACNWHRICQDWHSFERVGSSADSMPTANDRRVCIKFILRVDWRPSRIEHLFLGYGDKWPRKWPGIGRALANPVPISQSCANRSFRCQSMPIHANPGKLDCQCPRIGLKLTLDWLGLASDWLGRLSWNCCWLCVVLC